MSKSKKNLVDPDDIIAHYGADCARWFVLSDSPPERDVIWTEDGVKGANRFIQRVWRIIDDVANRKDNGDKIEVNLSPDAIALRRTAHKTLHSVGQNIEHLRFNVAVAGLYELTNAVAQALGKSDPDVPAAVREATLILVQLFGTP